MLKPYVQVTCSWCGKTEYLHAMIRIVPLPGHSISAEIEPFCWGSWQKGELPKEHYCSDKCKWSLPGRKT